MSMSHPSRDVKQAVGESGPDSEERSRDANLRTPGRYVVFEAMEDRFGR